MPRGAMVTVGITSPGEQRQIGTKISDDFCCRNKSCPPFDRVCGRHIGVTQAKESPRMTANSKEMQCARRFLFSLRCQTTPGPFEGSWMRSAAVRHKKRVK